MVRTKVPVILGNTFEILGTLFAFYLIFTAPTVPGTLLRFFIYLVSWGFLVFFPHGIAHYFVGRVVGVRFSYYFMGKSSATKLKLPVLGTFLSWFPVPTLRIERASFRSVSHRGRTAMFASGAIASMVMPFFAAAGSIGQLPTWLTAVLFLISVVNLVFDLYYSPRVGDLHRAKYGTTP